MGPIPSDNEGMKYIFVFVDAFSRFTILKASKTNTANEVAYALIHSVIANYGIPFHIHSDNGSEFSNSVLTELFSLLNITNSFAIPHHHQSNGLVERRNRDVNQNLKRLIYDINDFQNWASHLPIIQLIINSKLHSTTKFTPYQLLFGIDTNPRRPSNDLLNILLKKPVTKIPFINDLVSRTSALKRNMGKSRQESEILINCTQHPRKPH
ncbi:hypothetical protein GEMRC1_010219 [Eukaryota sp. GEM-RC1]